MHITEASGADLEDVLEVERSAFGGDEEAELVRDLVNDPSAAPLFSLLAYEDGQAVGHILFTAARLAEAPDGATLSILAPLAVIPSAQRSGVGSALIERGLQLLAEAGVDLVFVLGHPDYYPRLGFEPAGRFGFAAPFPIAEADADAWMVRELRAGVLGSVQGTVVCADTMNEPRYWQE